jgi:NAD(P)-dependent dehydrogenase (short-subunit alcohol dehydrogenase family)
MRSIVSKGTRLYTVPKFMSMSSTRPSPAGQVALVTDAASSLGRIIARALAQQGWDLALHYQHGEAATLALAKDIQAGGGRALAIPADLSDEAQAKSLVPRVIAALGSLSCVVNNATLLVRDSAADFSAAQLEQHMRSNLAAPILLAQALHAATPEGRQAVVVNLLDQKLFSPQPDFLSYTLSKAALHSATQLLAQALAPRLRVVGIAPALDPNPVGPLLSNPAHADDLAASICFIAASSAITGTTLLVDGGRHLTTITSLTD